MQLVKITCELKYTAKTKLLSGYEGIYKDLLKKEPEQPERWVVPGLRLEDEGKKQIWLIDPVRGVIDIEQPPNVGFCKDSIMQFFKSVNERVGIPSIGRYGLRATWLKEHKGSFQELLDKCKSSIFGESKLVEKVGDVGAVFDYFIDTGKKLSVTVGPMELAQLKSQFLVFEPQSFPNIFLYIAVDMGDTTTNQFSPKYLNDFLQTAIQEGERLSNEIVSQIGV